MLSSRPLSLGALLLFVAVTAHAQITAQWANVGTDFSSPVNWVGNVTVTSVDVAQFSTSGIVSFQPQVNSALSVGGISFAAGAGSFSITGTGSLTIGSNGLDNEATAAQTISVPLSFLTSAPTILNNGTLTLGGLVSNNASPLGLTITNNGVMSITGGVANNGAMGVVFNGSGTNGSVSAMSGGSPVTVSGTGKWTFGASTYTGNTTLTGGTLAIGSDAGLGSVPNSATPGSLTLNGGTLETTASFTLNANRGIALSSVGGTIQTDSGTTLTYAGAIAGPGGGNAGFNKTGAGTLSLGGSNTFTGSTNIIQGVLTDSVANAYSPGSSVNVAAGANLNVTQNESILSLGDYSGGSGTVTISSGKNLTLTSNGMFSGTVAGGGALTLSGSGAAQTLTGANTYTGGTTIGAGTTLQIGIGSTGVGGTTGSIVSGNIVDNGTLLLFRQGAYTYGGISGTGSVRQTGSGTLTFSGSNSYSGGTFISSGAITDQSAGALSPNSSVFMYGGTLTVTGNEQIKGLGDWVQNSVTSPGTVTIGSGATLTLTGGSTFSGTIGGAGALNLGAGTFETIAGTLNPTGGTTIQSGANLQIGNGGATGTLAGTVLNNGALSFNESGSVAVSGISGTGSLTQSGTGTLTLGGSNSYTGQTRINGGTLADAAANSFSSSSPVFLMASGTALNVNFNETINGLGGATASVGSTTNIATGATLTINNSGLTYNGTIAGNGALVVTGAGSQTIGGANTYAGGTTINSGNLIATNTAGSATGSGTVTVGTGALLQLGANGPGGMVSGNIIDNGTVLFASTDTTANYSHVISGAGNLSVGFFNTTTGGVLTLSQPNTYAGNTNIGSGTLVVGTNNALPTSTAVAFGNSGVLNVANNQQIARFLNSSTSSTIILGGGKTLTVAPTTGSFGGVFSGTISGSGTLTFAGASGTGLVLTSGSVYSGGTNVTSGTLYLGSSSSGSAGAVASGPVGTGAVNVSTGAGLSVGKGVFSSVTLANNVNLTGSGATLIGGADTNALVLGGTVAVPTSAATVHLNNLVEITGTLKAATGSTALTVDTGSSGGFGNLLLLTAPDTSIATITASGAGVVFGSQAAVPTSGLTLLASNGYVGVGAFGGYTPPTAASVLNLISNRATFAGTLGFDSDPSGVPHVFSDNLNLAGFGSSFTIGSQSSAVLTGTITPPSTGYAFGNGTGGLFIQSALTGAYGVTVNSTTGIADNSMLAIFQGANSYTGNLAVTNSGAVLDSATALPAGRTVSLGANGYVGYTEAFTGVSSFADFVSHRLTSYTSTSIVGLDSNALLTSALTAVKPAGYRYDSEAIDLSALSSVYFGTATNLLINGLVKAPNNGGTLSLLAGADGTLVIASPLIVGNVSSVIVGSSTSPFGKGTVALFGDNTYTGGTQLQSGTLVVGSDTRKSGTTIVSGPIGSGTLTVTGSAVHPVLAGSDWQTVLDNPIAAGTNLQLGLPEPSGATETASRSVAMGLVGYNSLVLNGTIGDLDATHAGSLTIVSDTELNGSNTFTGGVTLQSGRLTLGSDSALGTGTLTIAQSGSGYVEIDSFSARTLSNNIVYNGGLTPWLTFGTDGGLTLNGSLTLNNNVLLELYSDPVRLNGALMGNGKLTLQSGTLYLSPVSATNTLSGGIEALGGTVVFGNAAAIPNSGAGLTADPYGYIGISFVPSSLQSGFLDKFNKSGTTGTIGFDSASVTSPNTFTGTIDLRGFSSLAQLGSASAAIIGSGATIIPQSNTYTYNFGGGGGSLQVNAALTDDTTTFTSATPRSVNVTSPSDHPLTLTLAGTNSYSGTTSATYSAIVFAAPSAISANTSFVLNAGGYIGLKLGGNLAGNDSSITGFLSKFTTAPTQGWVGFDAGTGNSITNLNLSALGVGSFGVATTSNLDLAGTLTVASGASAYRFAGYKGGQLTVDSVLTDGSASRSVNIGSTTDAATFSTPTDPNSALSNVTLNGANTYTGGTMLNAGALYVGNDSALGTGTLTIANSFGPGGQGLGLYAAGGSRTLANAIVLASDSALDLGGANNLTLTGSISGDNWLYKVGSGTLTLSGNNTFSSQMTVEGGSVVYTHGTSVGTGSLDLGSNGGSVTFLESSTVNGIAGYSSADTINVSSGTTLTINQLQDNEYTGTIAGSNIGMVFTGSATRLHLTGASAYTGTNTINTGVAVVAGNAAALGATTNPITVSGGKLAMDAGVTIANPITLTSGKLGGAGTFKVPAGGSAFSIGSGIILAPGIGGPGNLTFDGSLISTSALLLASNGGYNWQLLDATNAGGWDTVTVNGTVDLNATALAPFNFSLITLGADRTSGLAANFDPTHAYSWTVLTANHINGFTGATQFNINTSLFANATSGGNFTVGLNGTGTSLLLNFTPVPEPSTYALMFAGAAVTFLVTRRRRNRRG